jgi:hypothetical protein
VLWLTELASLGIASWDQIARSPFYQASTRCPHADLTLFPWLAALFAARQHNRSRHSLPQNPGGRVVVTLLSGAHSAGTLTATYSGWLHVLLPAAVKSITCLLGKKPASGSRRYRPLANSLGKLSEAPRCAN